MHCLSLQCEASENLPRKKPVKSGLTLIEVLIATTLTLLLLLALAQGFKTLSDTVSAGRAKLTLSDQLRGVTAILRNDLDRCTVSREVPQTYPGPGYFKYYDGPISDSTALQANFGTVSPLYGSRWGDIDDVVMFTAQAKPGEVFRGTVPQAVLIISQLNNFELTGKLPGLAEVDNYLGAINWDTAWRTEVTIESEVAEIAWFMLPMREGNRLPALATTGTPGYISPLVSQSVIDLVPTGGDGMPDNIALCRKVLPIRRDINLNPTPQNATYRNVIRAGLTHSLAPQVTASTNSAASFRTAMHQFYQRCDLSLRIQRYDDGSGGNLLSVAANSLEDLQRPENRFAHFTYPVTSSQSALSVDTTTLPILALTDETGISVETADTAASYRVATDSFYNVAFASASAGSVSTRGFMLPCFMRARFDGTPIFSEIVASNVIAFDVRVFDPTAKQIADPGFDGTFGDGSTPLPGISGSDDASVSPGDPGYARLIAATPAPTISQQGAYVDMAWGVRLHTHPSVASMSNAQRALRKEYFRGDASAIVDMAASPAITHDPALNASGSFYALPNTLFVFHPCYDTYTNYYDSDGEKMDLSSGGFWFYRGGLRRFGTVAVPLGAMDDAADGIRNPNRYIDAYPPAPFEIPSVKVLIRTQDVSAGQLQQMSTIHSFPKP